MLSKTKNETIWVEGLGVINDIFSWASFCLLIGLSLGIKTGGLACIKHLTLRLVLWTNGYIPWNYARFLDYAAERIFLQKVGGSYIFIHRMLQDHFAQMPLERVDPKSECSKHGERSHTTN